MSDKSPKLMTVSFSVSEEEHTKLVAKARNNGLQTSHQYAKVMALADIKEDEKEVHLKRYIENHKKQREWLVADLASINKLIDRTPEDNVINIEGLYHRRNQAEEALRKCPDDGTCHHDCQHNVCFRVRTCAPLSLAGDTWLEVFEAAK